MTPIFVAIVGSACLGMLQSLRRAMQTAGYPLKAFAVDTERDHAQLARAFVGDANLTADQIARTPTEVQQYWHLYELKRLGLPEDIETALEAKRQMARMDLPAYRVNFQKTETAS